jgi:hypothetical protein
VTEELVTFLVRRIVGPSAWRSLEPVWSLGEEDEGCAINVKAGGLAAPNAYRIAVRNVARHGVRLLPTAEPQLGRESACLQIAVSSCAVLEHLGIWVTKTVRWRPQGTPSNGTLMARRSAGVS